MTDENRTRAFLAELSLESKQFVINAVSNYCQISKDKAYQEITSDGAGHLLTYMVEPERTETCMLMLKHNAI